MKMWNKQIEKRVATHGKQDAKTTGAICIYVTNFRSAAPPALRKSLSLSKVEGTEVAKQIQKESGMLTQPRRKQASSKPRVNGIFINT